MRQIKCWNCGKILLAEKEATLCPECRAELKSNSTLLPRKCRSCGATFIGGPRAWYCPECRIERQRKASRDCKDRLKLGKTRKIGSTDLCTKCGKEYVVSGGNQKYCPDCSADAVREIDRQQSRAWAQENREAIKARKSVLSKNRKTCVVCGCQFYSGSPSVTCSPECAKINLAYHQALADHKRRGSPMPTIESVAERFANRSGVTGVTRSRNGQRWVAQYHCQYIGTFDSIQDASDAIERFKLEHDEPQKK